MPSHLRLLDPPTLTAPGLPAARGLLLDFGGVIVETSKTPGGVEQVVELVREHLARADYAVDLEELTASLRRGYAAMKAWRDADSTRREPRELTHREVVADFLAADLPEGPRTLLMAEATDLLTQATLLTTDFEVRPGIPELFEECRRRGVPIGIVSNATAGRVHRIVLDRFELTQYVDAQVYSDEAGIHKPHPGMVHRGAQALGLSPEQTWFVGDTFDRDVVSGVRAGVGAAIVTRSKRPFHIPEGATEQPALIVDSPAELVELIRTPTQAPVPRPPQGTRPALLVDHGGVISLSSKNPAGLERFATELATQLGENPAAMLEAIRTAAAQASARKRRLAAEYRAGTRTQLPELQPEEFFDVVAAQIGHAGFFRAEARELMYRYAIAKSTKVMREGMEELFRGARELGMVIVVVSNTLSGRSVRHHCRRYGLDKYISAYVCSDELNARKPAPEIYAEALRIAQADPARTWFLGDKPLTDALGAVQAGIAHPVVISGGSTPREDLTEFGSATVVDSPIELLTSITTAIRRK